jgi:RNA-splicing ligase RtcB
MFEIKGKNNTAICYANVVEDGAIEQIRRMCDYALTDGSRIRIMPDVHAGKGCTIGTTMTVHDKVCPNIVGVDIGCGMYTLKLKDTALDFERIDEACHYIPSGLNVWEGRMERFDLTCLCCYRSLRDTRRLERSLGTLGGGNHFIEVDKASNGTYYLVIHSGSRNLGKQVAELYQKLAIDLHSGKEDYFTRRDEIIATYKAEGRRSEIQTALKDLEKEYSAKVTDAPEELCWLYGTFLEDYLHDVEICQSFARRSRERMAEIILERTGMVALESFHTIHNYIDTGEMILRKGAIAAHAGEKVLIPINMRDGSVLAIGKGNPDWNYSAPHGAGRVMSRAAARESLSLDEYKASMAGVYTTSVSESTIDEAPMVYKSLEDIVSSIGESVDIVDIIKPVYNFKANDDDLPWKKRGSSNGESDTRNDLNSLSPQKLV